MPTPFAAVDGVEAFACVTARSLVSASMRRRSLAGAASFTGFGGAACTGFGTGLASAFGSSGFSGCGSSDSSVSSGGTSRGVAVAVSEVGLSTIATAGFCSVGSDWCGVPVFSSASGCSVSPQARSCRATARVQRLAAPGRLFRFLLGRDGRRLPAAHRRWRGTRRRRRPNDDLGGDHLDADACERIRIAPERREQCTMNQQRYRRKAGKTRPLARKAWDTRAGDIARQNDRRRMRRRGARPQERNDVLQVVGIRRSRRHTNGIAGIGAKQFGARQRDDLAAMDAFYHRHARSSILTSHRLRNSKAPPARDRVTKGSAKTTRQCITFLDDMYC